MDKKLIIIILMLASFTGLAKTVKFAVDMTGQPVSPNGVHVAGDFQEAAGYEGGNWQSNTTVMNNEAGTDIYSVFVDIPAFSKYEYTFINGDQWYEVEFVPIESRVGYDFNTNRWVYIDSLYNDTTSIPPVLFSGNAPVYQYLFRLKVNLQLEDEIDPAGVHVAGDFQNWDPASTIMYSFVEEIYESIIYLDMTTEPAEYQYRFINGNTMEDYETVPGECAESGNRFVEVFRDTVMEVVCFSGCSDCGTQGMDENTDLSSALIFPNPCIDFSTLKFNDAKDSHRVIIVDLLGNTRRVYNNCTTETLLIRREDLNEGIYIVKIESGNYWLKTLRLVISN